MLHLTTENLELFRNRARSDDNRYTATSFYSLLLHRVVIGIGGNGSYSFSVTNDNEFHTLCQYLRENNSEIRNIDDLGLQMDGRYYFLSNTLLRDLENHTMINLVETAQLYVQNGPGDVIRIARVPFSVLNMQHTVGDLVSIFVFPYEEREYFYAGHRGIDFRETCADLLPLNNANCPFRFLSEPPPTIKLSPLTGNSLEAFNSYNLIGKCISDMLLSEARSNSFDHHSLEEIEAKLKDQDTYQASYIFLLIRYIWNTLTLKFACVLHLLCRNNYSGQHIYDTLSYSFKFIEALKADMEVLEAWYIRVERSEPPDIGRLMISGSFLLVSRDLKFQSLGVISELLRLSASGEIWPQQEKNIEYGPKSISDLIKEVDGFGKPVIVCLDEFCPSNADSVPAIELYFARNLLRACGFVLITMGTDSSAVNLTRELGAEDSKISGRSEDTTCWAHVITSLPRSTLASASQTCPELAGMRVKSELLNWALQTKEEVDELIVSMRPGLLAKFFKVLEQQLKLNLDLGFKVVSDALRETAIYTRTRAPKSSSPNGMLGQFLLHFARDKALNNLTEQLPEKLVESFYGLFRNCVVTKIYHCNHLVRYNDQKILVSYDVNGRKPIISETFSAASFFPAYLEDELSYIVLLRASNFMDLQKYCPENFNKEKSAVTSERKDNYNMRIISEIAHDAMNPMGHANMDTKVADKRDGCFLEALGLAAMVRASVRGELCGQSFDSFLLKVCQELSLVDIPDIHLDSKSLKVLGSTANFLVPLYSVVNATYSENFRKIPGVYTGTLRSVKNLEEIDGIGLPDDIYQVPSVFTNADILTKLYSLYNIHSARSKDKLPTDEPKLDGASETAASEPKILLRGQDELLKVKSCSKGLLVTTEMKNASKLNFNVLESCTAKAVKTNNLVKESTRIMMHVHIIHTVSVTKWRPKKWRASGLENCRVLLASFDAASSTLSLQQMVTGTAKKHDIDIIVLPIETMFVHPLGQCRPPKNKRSAAKKPEPRDSKKG